MSFCPGLLAGTSRLVATGRVPLAARSIGVRAIMTSAALNKAAKDVSVQASDKENKMRERLTRRLPLGIDMAVAYEYLVFEPIVDPDFQLSWLMKKEGREYAWQRIKRWYTTKRYAYESATQGLFPGDFGAASGLGQAKSVLTRADTQFSALLTELDRLYQAYQKAQASGDVGAVSRLSLGPAKERGAKVAQAVSNTQWEFVKHNQPPHIVSVRSGPLSGTGDGPVVCQVVVRFDTTQKITTRGQERQVNVVDNVVFDSRNNSGYWFVVQNTLPFTQPEFLEESK